MDEMSQEFQEHSNKIREFLSQNPMHPDALALYALYKQSTIGDVNKDRPRFFDFKGKAKWDAWSSKQGLSRQDASTTYIEMAKKILRTELEDGPMEEWIRIVKGVLPQVPESVIQRDLEITGNVDETITKLLDGSVHYEPEIRIKKLDNSRKTQVNQEQTKRSLNVCQTNQQNQNEPPNQSAQPGTSKPNKSNPDAFSAPSPMSFSTKAIAFEKNPSDRMQSYQERKKQLLEVARKHFIEKNGLQK